MSPFSFVNVLCHTKIFIDGLGINVVHMNSSYKKKGLVIIKKVLIRLSVNTRVLVVDFLKYEWLELKSLQHLKFLVH